MVRIKYLVIAAALACVACDRNAPANTANAGSTAATPSVAPAQDALVALETSALEAWKSKDAAFWGTFLSDKFVGYGPSGRLDKASATRQYTGTDCDIKSFALSDAQTKPLGEEAALLTYRTTVDGACGGQLVPAASWAASVYVRDGENWKGAFHAEAPVVDPKASSAKPVDRKELPAAVEAQSVDRDPGTDAMLAVEKALWEAWREHDAATIEALATDDISFINIFGTYFGTRAEALRDWTGSGCDVKSVSVTDATGTMLSPTVGILRFNGAADGTCYGQKIEGSIWGTSIYVKDGDTWKWTFGINVPASQGA